MNFSSSIPVAQMQAANATLEAQGFGPDNFSVPAYAGPSATYALLHCWHSPVFEAAVAAIPGVVIQQELADPIATTTAVANTANTDWSNEAKLLTGTVTPGLHRDAEDVLWWVIQSYDTAIWSDPTLIPALIRRAKIPGEALPWVQPLDQFDAYKLVNPFTNAGDLCTHNGFTWKVVQADGAGNIVWEPGVFGWVKI